MEVKLYVFDDAVARGWQPFALTRPIGEMLFGAHTFRARAERLLGVACAGLITSDHLQGFEEPDAARVVRLGDVPVDAPRVFISSRALVDWNALRTLPAGTSLLRAGDDVIGCSLPAGAANPTDRWIEEPAPDGSQIIDVAARVLGEVWDLVAENPAQITRDHEAGTYVPRGVAGISIAGNGPAEDGYALPDGCDAIGYSEGMLRLGADVTIEPNVVLDFSHGPIHLDDGVTVRAFTRLAGPAYVGRNSTLLGGPYEAVSIGPVCRVHGELEESVVLGYSNKAHDGFLGHAYLGRWVNLGALTTNSDLKNNYGTIRMWTPEGERDTGLIKLGCLLGDYVKTGIGALINTGTVIGAGSSLYGTDMPPKYVPPFSWGSGSDLVEYDVDKFLSVTGTVMGRRGLSLSEGMRDVLARAWQLGRSGQ
jgi:UDP-N-acetylglucosamine diphosphorylase / glucose-1-phosphate thymidylyltransferase / UDP-N-acetylgalactosamine diphosphorylase / glucosamine-1-phosphate N-acetyltransferase / galactosamine-1-phosphate N-acetyltransferase